MRQTKDLIVISDIHLAAERDCGLFRADAELAEFLLWVLKETKDCCLVLNGDVLDFLVSENGSETITVEDAKQKVRGIIEKHKEVFDALAELANSPEHQLIIISGNHDPELANPIVQSIIEDRLSGTNFNTNVRWITGGHAFLTKVGDRNILIEHGDLFDDFNRIDYGELHRTTAHLSRLLDFDRYTPPPGSSLVENLSTLRKKHTWIDYIKPLSPGTFPLIWAFAEQEADYPQKSMFRKVIRDGFNGVSNWAVRKLKDYLGFSPFLADEEDTIAFAEWRESEIREPLTLTRDHVVQLIHRLRGCLKSPR